VDFSRDSFKDFPGDGAESGEILFFFLETNKKNFLLNM